MPSNLVGMTQDTPRPTDLPDNEQHPGLAIRGRRATLGLSQREIENLTNGVLYQNLQSKIETDGDTAHRRLRETPIIMAYLDVLHWSPLDFREETGIDIPVARDTISPNRYNPTQSIPTYVGLAGSKGGEPIGQFPLDPTVLPKPATRRLEVRTVHALDAVTDTVRARTEQGDMFIVEVGATPRPGDTVIAYVEGINTWVAFVHTTDTPLDVAQTYDPEGPVFRLSHHKLEIDAVVRLRVSAT